MKKEIASGLPGYLGGRLRTEPAMQQSAGGTAQQRSIGANPTGALPWVDPMMMKKNIMVRTISAIRQATRLYLGVFVV